LFTTLNRQKDLSEWDLTSGSGHDSDNASIHNEAPNNHQQQNIQPQIITTVTNNNAKFLYLKKDEYEVWAIKIEYWITNSDMNISNVIKNGNSLKRTGRGTDGSLIFLPPTTAEEHLAIQRESKARTTLLQSILDDHIADFHYMDDAKDIWNAIKARFRGNAESKKMRNLYAKEISLRFLRALPSSWFQVALTLKTKGGLEFLSFDDLYYKLKTLKMDIKGYSTFSPSQSTGPSHTAFVSATSTNKKLSYDDCLNLSSMATYSVLSNSKTGTHRTVNVIKDVLQSFVADTEPEQQLAYEDLEQIEKLDREEMDLKWKIAMLSVRVHKFEQKAGRKINFDKTESARFTKQKVRCYKCQQKGHFSRECRAKGGNDKQRYSSFKNQEIGRKDDDSKALVSVDTLVDWSNHTSESDKVIAAKEFGMIAGANSVKANTLDDIGEFVLIKVSSETTKKDLQTQLDNHLAQTEKLRNSSKNLYRLIDNVEGRPTFHRFAKTDSMKVVPPPLTGDYISLSDHTDLDESQMFYGTKSSTSNDFESVNNDFVSYDDSDKSSEDNTSDFASCDSSGKSLEHKPTEIESNVGTPITEPISVKDLPSFACNSSENIDHTSTTSCNKRGSYNKKACHFKKHVSSVSKLCFVCRSHAHLIKDCDFYKKQMANLTVGIGAGHAVRAQPVLAGQPKVKSVPTGRPKVNPVPTAKPKVRSVPTSKPQVTSPVFAGRPNRPFPVPTDGGYSPSETSFLATENEEIFNSGCSRSMTGNKDRLDDFQAFHGGKVTFGDTECLVLSKDFKLPDDSMVVLKMIELCGTKGIKSEYSNPRSPQQNRVAERKTKTLIEAAITMLADSKLPTMFWTEAVRTACYVLNRVSVTNPHNKTPYALLTRKIPTADEGYLIGYSTSNKAYRVYNVPTKRVKETMDLHFLKDKPNVQGLGHEWHTQGNTTTSAGTQDADSDSDYDEQVIIIPSYPSHNIQGTHPIDTTDQEQQVTIDAKELRTPASVKDVLPSCIPISTGLVPVPTGSLPVATGSVPVPTSDTTVPTDDVLVHTGNTTDSMFDGKPTTRFPCPSDLGNHNPLPGIFSSSAYVDEFDTALNNVDSSF
nr:hypothetical protein [Tanacetum cinerariifolium]